MRHQRNYTWAPRGFNSMVEADAGAGVGKEEEEEEEEELDIMMDPIPHPPHLDEPQELHP